MGQKADEGENLTDEDNVPLIDPDLLPQLSANVAETLRSVETERFQPTVTQHLAHLQPTSIFIKLKQEGFKILSHEIF